MCLLNEIGAALSAVTDSQELLARILSHARAALRADGGSVYLVEGEALHFAASQNDTVQFEPTQPLLPIDDSSLAGFVANNGRALRLAEAGDTDHSEDYRLDASNDEALGYQTRSALLVPMLDRDGEVLGGLALFNRKPVFGQPLTDFDHVRPCAGLEEELARSIASQATVALENHRLYKDIRGLFDGFVTAAVSAIEARDPSTAGHSQRVARLTTRLARACSDSDALALRGVRFDDAELEELRYASVLHDLRVLDEGPAVELFLGQRLWEGVIRCRE